MRLFELKDSDQQLSELAPALGAVPAAGSQPAAQTGIQPAAKVGSPPQSGQPPGGLNPAQAAMAAKQQQDRKKEIQDAIKQKQQELQDLQKQLAQLG